MDIKSVPSLYIFIKGLPHMRLQFRIFMIIFITTSLYAEYSLEQIQQAKEIVRNNPSLLNTPEAKSIMQQNRLTQDKTIIRLEDTELSKKNNLIDAPINDLEKEQLPVKKDDINVSRLTPLKYLTNEEELTRIKSVHKTREDKELKRFSNEFFRNKNKISQKSINTPKDYIISRGDTVTFWIYGATNKQHTLSVNNKGNINIPEIGPVRVAGEKYSEVKELLTNYLSSSYKNSEVVVDLDSFSTAQVTLTGFVNAPGIFNTSSVSSVKDILIEADGVSNVGSVRNIQIKRAGQTIATIDYYHLLNQGLERGDIILRANDTIYVPRAYGLIRLEGAVNKEAIFEIEKGESLAQILKIAGGMKSQGDGLKIHIKRYINNSEIKYHKITLREARNFKLKDGDEVYVGEMGVTHEKYIEIVGNVIIEGKREISTNTIKLSSLLKKEIRSGKLNSLFLENTQLDYAVVKRVGKDLSPEIFNVNLANILEGTEDFTLFNRDVLYVYNKLDTKINPYVTISQILTDREIKELNATKEMKITQIKELNITNTLTEHNLTKYLTELNITNTLFMQDGKHLFNKGMTLKDLINAAGIKGDFDREKVKIVSHDIEDKRTNVQIINYQNNPNFPLNAFDKVYLFNFFETNPTKIAHITGEVIKPGDYEVSENMTLEKFILSAGGLNERAYPKECEIVRYHVKNGERKKEILTVNLTDIGSFIVKKHDEINIKRIPNWHERKIVTIKGEVKFPGTYVIHSGEKLSSVIKRAGGYTKGAFLYGAIFTRVEVAKLQKDSLRIELSKLKEQVILASLRASGSKSMNSINITESIQAVESLILEAEQLSPVGRISINLGYNENASCDEYGIIGSKHVSGKFEGTASDLTLKDKDVLHIPSFNDTVIISGEVMNPMASIYLGESINDYISKSGGITELADTDHIYVLHANGEAQKATLGSYLFSSNKVSVKKGDIIIVPKKLMFQRGIDVIGEVADIFYKLTLTVAAMNSVGAL